MKFVDSNCRCYFCENGINQIDYKDVGILLRFVDYFGRMKKSYYKGNCRKHQSRLALAIKRAREMALLSYKR